MTNPDTLFSICGNIAMLGWLLLIISPLHQYLRKAVNSGIIPILLSIVYLYLIITYFGEAEGGFGSLEDVMALFTVKGMVLAGWVHYLAFDLWIGTWELEDSKKRGIHHLIMIPVLVFTFMLGPIGLLLYFVIRAIYTKTPVHYDNY